MSDRCTFLSGLFPDLIISEILTRLPAKSICRFKCVSKRWNSNICHPSFLSSYISRASPSSSSSWFILNRIPRLADESTQHSATQLSLLDRPKVSTFSVNPHKLAAEPVSDPKFLSVILHSSNGLLLMTVKIKRDPHKEHAKDPSYISWRFMEEALFVVNPVTREWVPLPKPRRPINKITHVGFTTRVDPETGVVDKFMAVEYRPRIGGSHANLLCFSSDTGNWVEKPGNYMLGSHFWRAEGSFEFNGRLFWVDLSTGLITWDADPFDGLESEEEAAVCRFIPLPAGRGRPFNTPGLEDERCIEGGEVGGFIQYLEVFKKGNSVLKVWRLKDCDSGEWSLTYKVSRDNVARYLPSEAKNGMPKPCFVHPFEADVAYFETGDHIFSMNVRTQNVVTCASFQGHEFVIPFVLPRWPTPLPPRLYAAYAKEEGTEYFNSQEFVEAIKCYSKSIDLSPTAVAYANRAMAYLKVHSYREAENDCSEALKLDDKYFKVYALLRAKARKELGNLEGSMHDVEFALKLEPNNKEMITQYAEIKSLFDKASEAETVDGHGGAAGDPLMKIGE